MIFISRYKKLKVVVRPTIKYVANNKSGSEEVVKYDPVIVEFNGGIFNTDTWKQFKHDDYPDKINTVRSEDDLIKLMKDTPAFRDGDFVEHRIESKSDKRARLLEELALLEEDDGKDAEEVDLPTVSGRTTTKPKTKKVKKSNKKTPKSTDSVVDL